MVGSSWELFRSIEFGWMKRRSLLKFTLGGELSRHFIVQIKFCMSTQEEPEEDTRIVLHFVFSTKPRWFNYSLLFAIFISIVKCLWHRQRVNFNPFELMQWEKDSRKKRRNSSGGGVAFASACIKSQRIIARRKFSWMNEWNYLTIKGIILLIVCQPNFICVSFFSSTASTMHFSFLAAFFWLNTMCFNIWWTFRWVIN